MSFQDAEDAMRGRNTGFWVSRFAFSARSFRVLLLLADTAINYSQSQDRLRW